MNSDENLIIELTDECEKKFRCLSDEEQGVDEDPVFESVTVTLLSVFRDGDIEKNFRVAAQSFYRQFASVEQI